MAKIIINWKPFFEGSSTRDVLIEFAEGEIRTLKRLEKAFHGIGWPKKCRHEISKMKKIGTRAARIRARRAIIREGWSQ